MSHMVVASNLTYDGPGSSPPASARDGKCGDKSCEATPDCCASMSWGLEARLL